MTSLAESAIGPFLFSIDVWCRKQFELSNLRRHQFLFPVSKLRSFLDEGFVINNDGGDFADYIEVEEGTTVRFLFKREIPHGHLALEAAQVDGVDLWACPRCGCKDWRVRKTWCPARGIRRNLLCRHCGQGKMLTTEVPVPDGHRVVSFLRTSPRTTDTYAHWPSCGCIDWEQLDARSRRRTWRRPTKDRPPVATNGLVTPGTWIL